MSTQYDPMQAVIDWQLRSRFPKDSSVSIPSFFDAKCELENRLIGAIERSMNTELRDQRIYRLYCEDGYTQAEIGRMEALSQMAICKILRKFACEVLKQA